MKDLNDLYNELEKYNIPVVKVDFQNKKAGIITNFFIRTSFLTS